MPTRRPDPARERLWQKRLARWKASGLKVGAFCEREGVTPTAFAHWRKTLRERDVRRAEDAETLFVQVGVAPAPAALEVGLSGGRFTRVPLAFDPAHLRAVVAALEGPPC
jgi:hypothetical protein